MTARTSELLAVELDNIGLKELARMARKDEFHDYLSPHAMPETYLVHLLAFAAKHAPDPIVKNMIIALRARVIDGDFDADLKESDDWAMSPEGQEAFDSLIRREKP
jgi:hypothetical protein